MSSRTQSWFGIVSYCLATLFLLYEMAVQVSPSIMVHPLMHDLHIDAAVLGMMASAYFYSYTIMQIPVGLLFDRFPAKYLLLIAMCCCAGGLLFFSLTSQVLTLALGRFLMGIGSAFAFVGVLVIASRWFKRRYFAFLVGLAQMLAAVGAAGGQLPLSYVVNAIGWRASAIDLAWIGLGLAVVVFLLMRIHPSERELSTTAHWCFPSIRASLKRVLGRPSMWWIALYAFCSWAPIAVFASLWGVPFLMERFAQSNTEASSIILVIWLALAVTAPLLGLLTRRLNSILLLQVTALFGMIAAAALIFSGGSLAWWQYCFAAGIGIASAGQILTFDVVRGQQDKQDLGVAVGFINMAVVAGGALLQPLSGWILRWHSHGLMIHGVPQYSVGDYRTALLLVPTCFLVAAGVALFKLPASRASNDRTN